MRHSKNRWRDVRGLLGCCESSSWRYLQKKRTEIGDTQSAGICRQQNGWVKDRCTSKNSHQVLVRLHQRGTWKRGLNNGNVFACIKQKTWAWMFRGYETSFFFSSLSWQSRVGSCRRNLRYTKYSVVIHMRCPLFCKGLLHIFPGRNTRILGVCCWLLYWEKVLPEYQLLDFSLKVLYQSLAKIHKLSDRKWRVQKRCLWMLSYSVF